MKDCCIEGCQTSIKRDVMTFELPTSRVLRKKWLDAINQDAKLAPDARVCLRHFTTLDYETVRGRIRLKGKVVPTLFGAQARSPPPPKDPLDQPIVAEEPQNNKKKPTSDIHNGKIDNDNGKIEKHNEKVENQKCEIEKDSNISSKETENGHNDIIANNENIDNDMIDKDNEIIDKDNKIIGKDNKTKGKGNENKGKGNENKGKDNEIGKDNVNIDNEINKSDIKVDNTKGNKRTANKVNRKVKKKWVPMRQRPDVRDSESEDSVNSDVPPAPILEDLEEHLPNYQIANMKTERQIAAMTETVDPLPTAEVQVIEPHVPVFIELSVGQENNQGTEQPNDCLMVLESVQCDIDPTLMLEARAEDEECCEHIDLDDDDDIKTVTNKPSADPISLLTSSDEDDVILQEPHIDTLSVSDETDEDDLPLQKLIKKEKKTKKTKKKNKKPEAIQSILVGVTDFYCYHCQHISTCRSAHEKHVKTHLKDEQSQKTRVYQICKECGFTTSSKSQLHRHQRKHLNEKRYKCPLCTYRSKYNMSLMYHLKTHNFDPNMYNCGACGLKLDSKRALLKHQDACYELGAKVACDQCPYQAETKRELKIHISTAHK